MAKPNDEFYYPNASIVKESHIPTFDDYQMLYKKSIDDPEHFWKTYYHEFYWHKPPTGKFLEYNFDVRKGPISIKWFNGAETNICYNVLDRIIEKGLGDKVAFYWEGNDPEDCSAMTYSELLKETCKFANVLKSKGVKKGDRVAIYLPMILQLPITLLACARIGAIHSVVFGGYSADALAGRILDARCCLVITADGVWRGTKLLNLKAIVDAALMLCEQNNHVVKNCIVIRHLGVDPYAVNANQYTEIAKRPYIDIEIHWFKGRDTWWHEEMQSVSEACDPEWVKAEDPLFMLYTSGSTGTPKGVVHTVGGYMIYVATTFKLVFDYQKDDIYWATADIGWITGHSYVVYGPLAHGATGVIFEGLPYHPDAGRCWEIVDKYEVTKFYTAPTAIRALMKFGDSYVTKYSRKSLKILGTVGEPINPEAWRWYYNVVGNQRCPIMDTFWQTETGGHVLTPLPGCIPLKPGSATFPFFGVLPVLLNDDGTEINGPGEGYLVFKQPWPSLARTVYGNHERFETTYFKKFPGYYTTGDGCRRDVDGYYWITGRIDDMVNVSGHLISTAEIESALIEHPSVAESAVVSHPHPVKGECTYCFITLKDGFEFNTQLVKELKQKVRSKIGPFAEPDGIQNAPALPKTRSGKIMRRVLRKIACNEQDFGDLSTLADDSVIASLIEFHRSKRRNMSSQSI